MEYSTEKNIGHSAINSFNLKDNEPLKLKKKNIISIIKTTVISNTYRNPVKNSSWFIEITIPIKKVRIKKLNSTLKGFVKNTIEYNIEHIAYSIIIFSKKQSVSLDKLPSLIK